jgi:arabinoxylan arabinofuranohydrolase
VHSPNKEFQGYYAMGDNPYGPFEWKGAFAPKPAGAQFHHSVIEFKGQWYCFYHVNTPNDKKKAMGWNGERRIACFDRLFYNEDGTIKQMANTTNWMPGQTK